MQGPNLASRAGNFVMIQLKFSNQVKENETKNRGNGIGDKMKMIQNLGSVNKNGTRHEACGVLNIRKSKKL